MSNLMEKMLKAFWSEATVTREGSIVGIENALKNVVEAYQKEKPQNASTLNDFQRNVIEQSGEVYSK